MNANLSVEKRALINRATNWLPKHLTPTPLRKKERGLRFGPFPFSRFWSGDQGMRFGNQIDPFLISAEKSGRWEFERRQQSLKTATLTSWLCLFFGVAWNLQATPLSVQLERLSSAPVCPAEGLEKSRSLLREGAARVVLFEHRAVQDEALQALQLLPCRTDSVDQEELGLLWWLLALSQFYSLQEAGPFGPEQRAEVESLFAYALVLYPPLSWDKAVLGEEGLSHFESARAQYLLLPKRAIELPSADSLTLRVDGQQVSSGARALELNAGVHLIEWSAGQQTKRLWWTLDLDERAGVLPGPASVGMPSSPVGQATGASEAHVPDASPEHQTGSSTQRSQTSTPLPSPAGIRTLSISSDITCHSIPLVYCGVSIEPSWKIGEALAVHAGAGIIGHAIQSPAGVAILIPVSAGLRLQGRVQQVALALGLSWQGIGGGGFESPRLNAQTSTLKMLQIYTLNALHASTRSEGQSTFNEERFQAALTASTSTTPSAWMIQGAALEVVVGLPARPLSPHLRLSGGVMQWPGQLLLPQASMSLGLTWGGEQ